MLPILPTMGVGSYASPGWLVSARQLLRRGELGERDIEELFDDALVICIADQIEAGVDILSDGELRRQRFVFELYESIEGLKRLEPLRRRGVSGYDMAPHYLRIDTVLAPNGLGVVEEFQALIRKSPPGVALKCALPGPMTFARFIDAPQSVVADLLSELVTIVRAELEQLVQVGATSPMDFRTKKRQILSIAQSRASLQSSPCTCVSETTLDVLLPIVGSVA